MKQMQVVFCIAAMLFTFSIAQAQPTVSSKENAARLLKKNIAATGLSRSMINNFLISDAYMDNRSGNFLVYLQQVHTGIPVYNKISVYIFKQDTLVQKTNDFVRRIPESTARLASYSVDAANAVRFAAAHLSIPVRQIPQLLRKDDLLKRFVYRAEGLGSDSTPANLVWLPINNDSSLRLAWNVRIVSPDRHGDWFVRVDAQTGEWIDQNSLIVSEANDGDCENAPPALNSLYTPSALSAGKLVSTNKTSTIFAPPAVASASYRVYPVPVESANFGTRTLETDPWLKAGAGNNATTLGWHFDNTASYDVTRGNNVWAQEDLAGTNATTGLSDNSSTSIPVLTFDKSLDPIMNPNVNTNLRAAIDNVFYWSNIMHDVSYQYGFDEAAGNFQASNLGRGGIGNDYVHAFAEDGAGINNANFATPPDGQSPIMRMYQWNMDVIPAFHVSSPAAVTNNYSIVQGSINLTSQLGYTGTKTGSIVLVNDAAGTHQGCGSFSNAASVAGNIAMIDRGGGCSFVQKIRNAQNTGAIAVIMVNNVATAPVTMSGTDITITIPAVMISMADGATLKANLAGLSGSLSSTGVFRDGSLDNGIIAHEYTHGISNRLTGGPANAGCLTNAEQMGEGWSDYMALMMTTNWSVASPGDGANSRTIGTYAASQAAGGAGVRTYPYSTNMSVDPWTYGMMSGINLGEVHTVGEIWCSAIWDMTWNIIQQEGIDPDIYHGTKGNNIALQLVIEAMKYQPCSPGFLDARNAILKADSILYNYVHRCAIWNAFARRGMGKSASQGSSNSYTDQVAAADLPVGLGITKTADKNSFASGDNITYTIKAYCDCGALSNISIIDTLSASLSYVSSTGGTYSSPAVHFDGIGFATGETKTFSIQATVSGTYAAPVTLLNDSRDPASYSWTTAALTGATNWMESTTRSKSSSHAWFAADQAITTDFALISDNLLLDNISTLSFWHYFETDPGYDGGMVEISTDGGISWRDLGPYMTQNAYNSSLDPSTGGVGNRAAFTGSSGGAFIQTIITLSEFAGATAKIRFRFASDGAVDGEGWYVDDILLKNEKGIVNNAFAYNGAALLSKNNTYGFFSLSALPVHFVNFEAQQRNKTAILHWKVSEEAGVSEYVVERSAEGTGFVSIGNVASHTGAIGENDYYFTDNKPLEGDNYYRIAEKDLDGKSTRSVAKLLRFTDAGLSFRLVPVPTYNHLVQLYIGNTNPASFTACLLNTVGQTVKMYTVKAGINQLNLQNLEKGVYYLKVEMGGGVTTVKKLVIE